MSATAPLFDPIFLPRTAVQLQQLCALKVSGEDAAAFLQGQLSNDIGKLNPRTAQISSYNSPKGRMLAVMLVLADEQGYRLILPTELAASIEKRLRMFVLRAAVTSAADRNPIQACFGALPDSIHAAAPDRPWSVERSQHQTVLRMPGAQARYLILDAQAQDLPPGDWAWRYTDICAGVPIVWPSTQDHFVAQMANLDALDGISFDKGCYTGQEVIARLHYLGKLKRRMFFVRGDGEAPMPASAIKNAGGDGSSVGEVVDAVSLPGGGFVASTVLQVSAAESDDLCLEGDALRKLSKPVAYQY